MTHGNMREALQASVRGEEDAIGERFAKAEAFFAGREQPLVQDNGSSPASTKPIREKVIRDGFSMPAEDYQLIAELQSVCLQAGISATKSEVLRAGLHALCALPPAQLKELVRGLEKVKQGRPGK